MKKALIIILTYNAENHIEKLLSRLSFALSTNRADVCYDILLLDDASQDRTVEKADAYTLQYSLPILILKNPSNQGYGGNQKIGYAYAIHNGYDIAVMLHGDGQYPPEYIDALIQPLILGEADAMLGSRMLDKRAALRGKMPLYKLIGNIIITRIQNILLGSALSEFHTGFRAYSLTALKTLPFYDNSNDFDFDTDLLIQFLLSGKRIKEISIPTHYGDEVCHVNGMRYMFQVIRNSCLAQCQGLSIFYNPKFDIQSPDSQPFYKDKTGFASSHSWAVDKVTSGARVLDIGCSTGAYVAHRLQAKNCAVRAIDEAPLHKAIPSFPYRQANLGEEDFILSPEESDVTAVLLLDVIEHLENPERFMQKLRLDLQKTLPVIYLTTPNIAFFTLRFGLLLGQFNYGKRGILDMGHKRLFTFTSLKRFLKNQGYGIESMQGIPAPFPLAFSGQEGKWLLALNHMLIYLNKRLFSYQIAVIARPLPTVDTLIGQAEGRSGYSKESSTKSYSNRT